MSVLEKKALECVGTIQKENSDSKVCKDASFILVVIEIIAAVFSLIKECKKTQPKLLEMVKSPRISNRITVNRLVRKTLKDKGLYKDVSPSVVTESLLSCGKTMTEEEFKELVGS